MAHKVHDLFHAYSGQLQTYTDTTGSAFYGVKIVPDYPPGASNVASIMLDLVTAGCNWTFEVELCMGVDTDGASIWGLAHNLLNDSGVNTAASDSVSAFEANLYAQDWWKENDGFRIKCTPDVGNAQIRGAAIVR